MCLQFNLCNNYALRITNYELDKPQFRPLASYGHFGRNDIEVKWEELDKVEILMSYL